MILFCSSKDSFYGFFSERIQFFHPKSMSDIHAYFHVRLPYMSGDRFDMVSASGTRCQIWTRCTTCPAAFIFPVSIPVGRTVFQCLMVGTDVAVVILIIHILVFFEKTFFCHWSFIGQQRFDTVLFFLSAFWVIISRSTTLFYTKKEPESPHKCWISKLFS